MVDVKTLAKGFVAGVKTHKPEIMIGIGLAAGVGAIIVAVKETPACLEALDKAEAETPVIVEKLEDGSEVEVHEALNWKTKVVIIAKHQWGAAALEALCIFLVVYGSKLRFDWYAKMVTIYGVTKAELDDIKQVIAEQPENWKKKFTEKMAESHIEHSDAKDVPPECMTNTEVPMPKPLFWDDQAKVYFRMSEEELRDAIADFTFKIDTDPFQATSMNDWMAIIDHEEVANGDYYLMLANDPDAVDGPLKYNQIGVKEAPTGEPARAMKFSRDYHLDQRGLYPNL